MRCWPLVSCATSAACATWARLAIDTPAPPGAFEDSRRLTGPNRWFGGPAVTLVPLGTAARDPAALRAWAARVRAVCAALHWPDPAPLVHRGPGGAAEALSFAAPLQAGFTATELNEWAWERSADAVAPLAAQGLAAVQPARDDVTAAAAHFAARAAAEFSRPLARLLQAAAAHGVPHALDDDSLTLGAGSGSRTWPRAALPLPLDVPWTALHGVPTALVTGSNGKTTTTRVLAAIARTAGRRAGLSSTEGVWVDGQPLATGDYAGPAGARAVLRHPGVQLAVLETARGGLLRRGLAVDRADVAVVTNVSADHLGEYGVHSLCDIAEAKLVVARAVAAHGTLVLNADDAELMAAADALPHARHARRALFAARFDHPALQALRAQGGASCGVRDGRLWLGAAGRAAAPAIDLGAVADLPSALGGAAPYNLLNLAAAALAAQALGLAPAAIASTLQAFGHHPADNPGRLQRHAHRGATVLIDYAHNPDGLAQLLAVARALLAQAGGTGRLGLLLGQAGNRDDDAITALAQAAARFQPDRLVLKELPAMLRGRAPGSVSALLGGALRGAGVDPARIHLQPDEATAALGLLDWAQAGDVVVLPVHTAAVRERLADWLQAAGTAG